MNTVIIGENQREFYCRICGAEPGQPCIVISGDKDHPPGSEREKEHFYRGDTERPKVLIPDEPPFRALDATRGGE